VQRPLCNQVARSLEKSTRAQQHKSGSFVRRPQDNSLRSSSSKASSSSSLSKHKRRQIINTLSRRVCQRQASSRQPQPFFSSCPHWIWTKQKSTARNRPQRFARTGACSPIASRTRPSIYIQRQGYTLKNGGRILGPPVWPIRQDIRKTRSIDRSIDRFCARTHGACSWSFLLLLLLLAADRRSFTLSETVAIQEREREREREKQQELLQQHTQVEELSILHAACRKLRPRGTCLTFRPHTTRAYCRFLPCAGNFPSNHLHRRSFAYGALKHKIQVPPLFAGEIEQAPTWHNTHGSSLSENVLETPQATSQHARKLPCETRTVCVSVYDPVNWTLSIT
jgi:hypothetical protein